MCSEKGEENVEEGQVVPVERIGKTIKLKKLTVLIDMDGVLCDFDLAVHETYGKLHPEEPRVPLTERKSFYMARDYEENFGKLAAERVHSITQSEGFFENLKPFQGCVKALHEMVADPRLDVLICTSPLSFYQYVLREKFAWVEKYLGRDWTKRIVITKDKTVVLGHVLIDDRPQVEGLLEEPHWEHVLFTRPYNTSIRNKRRLNTWEPQEWRTLIDGTLLTM